MVAIGAKGSSSATGQQVKTAKPVITFPFSSREESRPRPQTDGFLPGSASTTFTAPANAPPGVHGALKTASCCPLLSIVIHCCPLLSIVVHCRYPLRISLDTDPAKPHISQKRVSCLLCWQAIIFGQHIIHCHVACQVLSTQARGNMFH